MADKNENKDSKFTVTDASSEGFIQIADDVVSSIIGLAVTEVEGVSKLTGGITRDVVAKIGKKNLSKGVRVYFEEGAKSAKVDVSIEISFGYNIVEVSKNIQEKVKTTLVNMTGIEVSVVNVKISGIDFNNETK